MKVLIGPACAAAGLALAAGLPGEAGADQCLAFETGLVLAADRAPEVSAAQAREDEAAAVLREANSLRWPQVSGFGRSGVGDTGLTSSQIDNQVGLRVSQRVIDFGDARLARYAALADLYRSTYDVQAQRIQAAAVFAEAYLSRLEAEAMANVISDRRNYFQRQQSAVDDLLARGGATRAESAQIAAQLASADADVLELNFLSERSATRITAYTGLSVPPCAIDGAEQLLEHRLSGVSDTEQAVDLAQRRNPQIGMGRSAINSLEAQNERERRSRLPVLEVVGIASYTYDDFREDWDYRDRVGVDVSVPILTGNSVGARRDRLQARLSAEESGLRLVQRNLREETEIVFRQIISLEAQLVRRGAVADSQRDYFNAISGEFEFGLGTLPDLVEARLQYEQAELDLVAVRFQLARRKLDLLRLTAMLPGLDGRESQP